MQKRGKILIEEADIVSFDIYDTLIERLVDTPTDIFQLTENVYNKRFRDKIYSFKEKRIKAESLCRNIAKGKEITLKEIYGQLYDFSDEQLIKLQGIEVELECSLVCRNEKNIELLNFAVQRGKKVFFISDMYLGCEVITQILKKCEICMYDKLYVSSEIGEKKSTGKLFDIVKVENKITSDSKWIHIGDNYKSDYLIPQKRGIECLFLRKPSSPLPNF